MDWFRDLGFLQKPGVETRAAKEIAAFLSQPPPRERGQRSDPGAITDAPAGAVPKLNQVR
jgi:hypothetical protein